MKTIIKIALIALTANCVPAEMASKQSADDTMSAKRAPETESNNAAVAKEIEQRPITMCAPKYLTHLNVKYIIDTNNCSTKVFNFGGSKIPMFYCTYAYSNSSNPALFKFDPVGFKNALSALMYDRYGFSPNDIEIRIDPTSAYWQIVRFYVVRDMNLPENERERLSFKTCEKTDSEYDVNLDQ